MAMFNRVEYKDLKARQQEAFNFQKVSAVLADYGFVTIRLSSDWGGADFIAQHLDGITFLKVQLKGRLTFDKKYLKHDLYICFRNDGKWFLYPHDELLDKVDAENGFRKTKSWKDKGIFHYPRIPRNLRHFLEPYRLTEGNEI